MLLVFTGFRNCSVVNSNCEVIYQNDQTLEGMENYIQIFINQSQQSFNTWRDRPGTYIYKNIECHYNCFKVRINYELTGDCEPPTSIMIYGIPVSIVLFIVIIEILALAGWKGITLFAVRIIHRLYKVGIFFFPFILGVR